MSKNWLRHSRDWFCESYFNSTSTIFDKHDKFINGFEHSCSLQQAEAEVKTTSQATILLILFKCTSHV